MNTVFLYGALAKEFGREHRFNIETAAEAIDALRANFPRFFNTIRHGHYRVIVGNDRKTGLPLDETEMPAFNLAMKPIHIIPVTKGRKRGGVGKVIAGVALIGLSAMTGGSALMGTALWQGGMTLGGMTGAMGMGLALTGAASLIAPQQKAGETKQSFTMSGPTNDTREGGIVPIAYGEVITGGMMINGAVSINKKDNTTSSDVLANFLR
ncbi:tail assembly protein [Paenirhodobacter populi]|uniref:Tail assembly protein n=1 Tax=Paenirhodobacter populi TaxID=2306993 RepID=A0A443JKQ4_9RHOB|nr:tail assembly protein [Sinirhodobacter populi]RWR21138.1 tail assembly protein [Sinirhodobacter populi]